MKFACDKCHTRYSLDDARVRGKVLKIRCKTCENLITVRDPLMGQAADPAAPSSGGDETQVAGAPSAMSAGARPVVAASARADWFVSFDGEQEGPLSVDRARDRIREQVKLGREAYAWRDGYADWLPVEKVPEFAVALRAAAPPAPPARSAAPPPPPAAPASRPPAAPIAEQPVARAAPLPATVKPQPVAPIAMPAGPLPTPAAVRPAIAPAATPRPVAPAATPVAAQPLEVPAATKPAATAPIAAVTPALPAVDAQPAQPVRAVQPPVPVSDAAAFPAVAPATRPSTRPPVEAVAKGAVNSPAAAPSTVAPAKAADDAPAQPGAPLAAASPAARKSDVAMPVAVPRSEPARAARSSGVVQTVKMAEPAQAAVGGQGGVPGGAPLLAGDKVGADQAAIAATLAAAPPLFGDAAGVSASIAAVAITPADAASRTVADGAIAEASPGATNGAAETHDGSNGAAHGMTVAAEAEPIPMVAAPSRDRPWMVWALAAAVVMILCLGGALGYSLLHGSDAVAEATHEAASPRAVPEEPRPEPVVEAPAPKPAAPPAPEIAPPRPVVPEVPPALAPPRPVPRPVVAAPPPRGWRRGARGARASAPPVAPHGPVLSKEQQELATKWAAEPQTPSHIDRLPRTQRDEGPREQVSNSQIMSVVTRNKKSLQFCYEQDMKHGGQAKNMRVDVELKIGISGAVTSVVYGNAGMANTDLGICLAKTIRRWHFPGQDAEYQTAFPLLLQAQ